MYKICCRIDCVDYKLEYSSEIKPEHIMFWGTLYKEPPFDFKYIVLNISDEVSNFEPSDLDTIVCDRITQIIRLNDNKK